MTYTTTKIVACCSLIIGALALSGHWLPAPVVAEEGGELQIADLQTNAAQAGRPEARVALAADGKRQPRRKRPAQRTEKKLSPAAGVNRKPAEADNEPPGSIFNDKLRGFKFRLQWTDVVTDEEARAFTERYSNKGNPEIIGAYPDAEGKFLIVIGPPEAEQAIRENLAKSIIELQGIPGVGNGSLNIRRRLLQSKGRGIIHNMAEIEAVIVQVAAAKDENRDKKMKQLDARLHAFEAELDVIEKQIQVVDKYLKRLEQQPFSETGLRLKTRLRR